MLQTSGPTFGDHIEIACFREGQEDAWMSNPERLKKEVFSLEL